MTRNERLLESLTAYDATNMKFYEAKQKLLQEGFEEFEIIATASDISYGRKTSDTTTNQMPAIPTAAQSASLSSQQILLDDLKKRRREAFGFDKESIIGLFSGPSRHGSIDMLGIPVGILLVIGTLVTALLYYLSFVALLFPGYYIKVFLTVYLLFIGAWLTVKVIQLNKKIASLEGTTEKPRTFHLEAIISYAIIAVLALTVLGLF